MTLHTVANTPIWAPVTKNTCWYCHHKVTELKRFCNTACAEAFDEDDAAMERYMTAHRHELVAETV